jgi:hypothetical protein
MYFQYNNLRQPLASCRVTIPLPQQTRDAFGNVVTTTRTWQVEGEVVASTQAEITTLLRQLETAYNRDGGDAILFLPDGVTRSAHYLLSRDTIGGVRSSWVAYPNGDGAEYVNGRRWVLNLTAEFPGPGMTDNQVQTYNATVSIIGNGGPRIVVTETRNTAPVVETVSRRTPIRASQQGQATAYGSWPNPDPPIWPQWLVNPEQAIERLSPQQSGAGINSILTTFTTTWNYQFVSPIPLTGYPSKRTR